MKIGIIGAGAIGRGYLPWVFAGHEVEYIFVDQNEKLIESLKSRGKYSSLKAKDNKLTRLEVKVGQAYTPMTLPSGALDECDAVFVNVGPRTCVTACGLIKRKDMPIILNENDPATVDWVKQRHGFSHVYFSIPDVITSNTAPLSDLHEDPNALVTEDGRLFVDDRIPELPGDYTRCSPKELQKQWTAKLYIHNTPHCIAAYLGALLGVTYLHESMQHPQVYEIVKASMNEMLNALKLRWDIPHDFLDWYAEKELSRFCNLLLHDPIARVAREPMRKLELEGRLVGAAQICLSSGFIPQNILKGIFAAMLFESEHDTDRHVKFMMETLSPRPFLVYILGLRQGEALEVALLNHFDSHVALLRGIAKERGGLK